jgi:nitrogen-specific signal transduction histidine kinase
MPSEQHDDIRQQLETLRADVRQIAHDISSPLGVLRMVTYYLQSSEPTREKREHYFKVITQNIERVEATLVRLRSITETPPPGHDAVPGSGPVKS